MIASIHIADVGKATALRLLRKASRPSAAGLRYAVLTTTAPLSAHLLPRVKLDRVGLVAAWDSERALDDFLQDHPLARELAHGWRARLQPTHVFGAWRRLDGLVPQALAMSDEEPAAVLTIGRLRLSQTARFLRASAAAEGLAVRDQSLLAATGLARPPALVATFSLWRSTAGMRAYARGELDAAHRAAASAHSQRPFHHESAFIRFRPYDAQGSWDGANPLAGTEAAQ